MDLLKSNNLVLFSPFPNTIYLLIPLFLWLTTTCSPNSFGSSVCSSHLLVISIQNIAESTPPCPDIKKLELCMHALKKWSSNFSIDMNSSTDLASLSSSIDPAVIS